MRGPGVPRRAQQYHIRAIFTAVWRAWLTLSASWAMAAAMAELLAGSLAGGGRMPYRYHMDATLVAVRKAVPRRWLRFLTVAAMIALLGQ